MNSTAPTHMGARVKSMRQAHGLTQRALAAAAGMLPQYLCDLERGRIRNPSVETLARIAKAMGIGVDELVGRGGAQRPGEWPEGLRQLVADPDFEGELSADWIETLLAIEHTGRRLQTKKQFLEAYLALRRVFGE